MCYLTKVLATEHFCQTQLSQYKWEQKGKVNYSITSTSPASWEVQECLCTSHGVKLARFACSANLFSLAELTVGRLLVAQLKPLS